MSEIENIKQRYEARKQNVYLQTKYSNTTFVKNVVEEREKLYEERVRERYSDISTLKLMEIGAGGGSNLNLFLKMGIPAKNIFANELLDDRVLELKKSQPNINIFPGNALDLEFKNEFDIVFQSTVFTSVLDDDFRKQLADKMWAMTKPGGMILWYDFIFSNPSSNAVKKVTRAEVKALFPAAKSIHFDAVTLAPPIARRIGYLYKLVNGLFPFLRTHVIAVIPKDK